MCNYHLLGPTHTHTLQVALRDHAYNITSERSRLLIVQQATIFSSYSFMCIRLAMVIVRTRISENVDWHILCVLHEGATLLSSSKMVHKRLRLRICHTL